MKISEYEVVRKIFKKDRWYVVLDQSFYTQKTIPNAVYVWLTENPTFERVPPGYVIHHLDRNELNDDISNLALMQRFHHLAHHSKRKEVKSKVEIDFNPKYRDVFFPTRKPRVSNAGRGSVCVAFSERINGNSERVRLYTYGGKKIKSLEQAQAICDKIWEKSEQFR